MKPRLLFPLLFCLLAGFFTHPLQGAPAVDVRQTGTLPLLSDSTANPGVAGAFSGLSNGRIILAGGSNFPQGYPWEGGRKHYSDDVYLLTPGPDGNYACTLLPDVKFPAEGKGLAHGASVTAGNHLYCFGGTGSDGLNRTVYRLTCTGGSVRIDSVSRLPDDFTPVAATAAGNNLYIHGVGPSANLLYAYTPSSGRWKELAACPAARRSEGAVLVRQHDGHEEALYLIGGRDVTDGTLTLFTDVWEYTPVHNTWKHKGEIIPDGDHAPVVVMAPAAVPYGSGHILVLGGDDGREFSRRFALEQAIASTDDPAERDSLSRELTRAFTEHPGFSRDILAYHAITDTWIRLGTSAEPLPAVTTAVLSGNNIVLPSGEASPGVRSDRVLSVRIAEHASFGWINYSVVALYLLIMLGMGFYFMRKENSTEQFFKGGSRIPWWAAGISIFATALSAITFLSIPAKAYAADWSMFMFNMSILVIVPVVIFFYLPFFRKLSVASAYEYLEQRFSRPVRYIAAAFFCVFMFARIAIVLFLPSLALNAVTGIDIYLCILLMGVVTLIYCTMGGIEAVVWGDVIQGFILVGGALASLFYMIGGTEGGLSEFVSVAVEDSKFHILDFAFDLTKPVFWVTFFGGFANQLLTYTSDQSVIQKYMTTKTMSGAKKSLWLNGLLSVPITVLFFCIGTGLYVFFKSHPELLSIGMQNTDSIFPHFMMCRLPAGMAGLLIAAVFAAAMSTLSSNINSISTVLTEDFLGNLRKGASDRSRMRFARWSGILVGGLGILMAVLLASFDIASLWDQFNFFLGLFTSGLGGFFMMGIFFKRIGTAGAITGFVGSMVVLLLFNSYSNVSFLLYGLIGLVSCCAIGYLSSFLFGRGR